MNLRTIAILCCLNVISACSTAPTSQSETKQTDLSEYKDVYQLVAAGSDCNDLQWMAAHCANDPDGSWIGGPVSNGGFCGEAGSSCNFAVASRNKELNCWQDDGALACK